MQYEETSELISATKNFDYTWKPYTFSCRLKSSKQTNHDKAYYR
jgi:hypothetical protein